MPTITDDETNLYISNLTGGVHNWIGAHRVDPVDDQFAWIDGSPLNAPWLPGNPSNTDGNELCVHMFPTSAPYNGSWNDYDCWSKSNSSIEIMNFVCQSDANLPIEEGISCIKSIITFKISFTI